MRKDVQCHAGKVFTSTAFCEKNGTFVSLIIMNFTHNEVVSRQYNI